MFAAALPVGAGPFIDGGITDAGMPGVRVLEKQVIDAEVAVLRFQRQVAGEQRPHHVVGAGQPFGRRLQLGQHLVVADQHALGPALLIQVPQVFLDALRGLDDVIVVMASSDWLRFFSGPVGGILLGWPAKLHRKPPVFREKAEMHPKLGLFRPAGRGFRPAAGA